MLKANSLNSYNGQNISPSSHPFKRSHTPSEFEPAKLFGVIKLTTSIA